MSVFRSYLHTLPFYRGVNRNIRRLWEPFLTDDHSVRHATPDTNPSSPMESPGSVAPNSRFLQVDNSRFLHVDNSRFLHVDNSRFLQVDNSYL